MRSSSVEHADFFFEPVQLYFQPTDLLIECIAVTLCAVRLTGPSIHEKIRQLFDRRYGRIPVQVASAAPLADDQVEQLRQKLRGAFQREPIMQFRVSDAAVSDRSVLPQTLRQIEHTASGSGSQNT